MAINNQRSAMHQDRDLKTANKESPDQHFRIVTGMLAARALDDADPLTRKHAIYLLGLARNRDYVEIFIRALHDPEKAVRAHATRALAAIGKPVSEQLILLLRDPDWKVRYRVAEILGMIQDKRAVELLIALLADEKDHVRYMAVKSLGELHVKDAVESIEPLFNDENLYVRRMADLVLKKLKIEENE